MNVNWNSAASISQWSNYQPARNAETTGAIANNNDPIFQRRNAETTGAVAMFDGGMNGAQQHQGSFCAWA